MTRIALVLHGNGSLGSYVAGACSELLLALERNRSDGEVAIDVITGSSSGGFTGGLLARSLVVNRHLVPWIERCWVEALDARHLFAAGRRDRSGVLDASVLDEISRALMCAEAAADDEPFPAFPGELYLGLATGRESADFHLTGASGAGDPVWDEIRRAAVAAGSAPLFIPSLTAGADASIADVGVLGSQSLALAGRLAARADGTGHERILVCIDPLMGRADRGPVLPALGGDVRLLDALIDRLPEIVDRVDDPGALALGRHLGDLAERAAEIESDGGGLDDEGLMDVIDDGLRHIEADDRFAPILARASSRSGRTRLAKLIYVLQAACGGAAAGPESLILIAPEAPDALACRALGSLGGFLSREWREADFRAGRRDARETIETSLAEWIDYEPDEEDRYRPVPIPRTLDPGAEAKLRGLVEGEVERQLADIRVGGLAGLFGGWKNALKKHTADRVLSSLRDELS